MLEGMYEWYIFALDVEDEDAQAGRASLARVIEAATPRGNSTSVRGGSSFDVEQWYYDHVGPEGLPWMNSRMSTPGMKTRIGFQALDFALDVSSVLFIWNPAAVAGIQNAKWISLGVQEALSED